MNSHVSHIYKMLACVLLAFAVFMAPGCSTRANHPGSVNAFDSQAYDSLLTIQAGLESAKVQFKDTPGAKEPLNRTIAAYNTAMASYKTYHTLVAGGGAGDQAALQSQIDAAKNSLASLTSQFAGAKK